MKLWVVLKFTPHICFEATFEKVWFVASGSLWWIVLTAWIRCLWSCFLSLQETEWSKEVQQNRFLQCSRSWCTHVIISQSTWARESEKSAKSHITLELTLLYGPESGCEAVNNMSARSECVWIFIVPLALLLQRFCYLFMEWNAQKGLFHLCVSVLGVSATSLSLFAVFINNWFALFVISTNVL